MKKQTPLWIFGLLQASGIATYVFFIASLMSKLQDWFGPTINQASQGTVFILMFIVSAMITSLIAFSYPFLLFWDQKKPKTALFVVIYTAIWLAAIFFFVLFLHTR